MKSHQRPRLLLNLDFTFLEDKFFAHNTSPNIVDIIDHSLEVGRRIIRLGDEDVIRSAIAGGSVQRFDLDESIVEMNFYEWTLMGEHNLLVIDRT